MDKIASFQINHLLLNPGIYVSRKDKAGDQILTTFDIRMTKPNYEPVMNTAEVHTIEHLGATFLRNNEEYKDGSYTLDLWAAGRDFISYSQAIMSRRI